MNRRTFIKSVGAATSVAALAGCAARTAVHSEVQAVAQVTDVEHHDGAVTAHIEVVSDDPESGQVGLHVHYFHGDACDASNYYHTHMPTAHVPSGEAVTIRDTYQHDDADEVGCVSAHLAE